MFVGALQIIFVIYIKTNRKTNRNWHRRKDTFCVLCFDIGMIFILFSALDFLYKFNRIFFARLVNWVVRNESMNPPIPQTMSKRFFCIPFVFIFVVLFFFAYHFQNFMPFYLFYAYHSQLWKSRMSNINWPLYQCGLIINCLSFLIRRLALLHKDKLADRQSDRRTNELTMLECHYVNNNNTSLAWS